MASELDVINLALGYLGIEPITGVDAPLPEAAAAKVAWPVCRNAFLQEFPWSFAKRPAALPLREERPVAWNFAYGVPEDFLVCYRVYQREKPDEPGTLPYEISLDEDGDALVLMCNYTNVIIDYGTNRPNVGRFSALAVDAVAYRLAFMLCQTLKHDPSEAQTLYQSYMAVLQAAKAADAAGTRSYPPLTADRYTRSRQSGQTPAFSRSFINRSHQREEI